MVQSMLMSMVAELLQDHPEFKDMDEMSAYVKFNDLCAEVRPTRDRDLHTWLLKQAETS